MISQQILNWFFSNRIFQNRILLATVFLLAVFGAFFAGYFLKQVQQTPNIATAVKPIQDKIITKYA